MIPYIGAIVAVGIGIFITFITGGLGKALAMAIVVIILQQIDANIINPKNYRIFFRNKSIISYFFNYSWRSLFWNIGYVLSCTNSSCYKNNFT